MRRPARSIFGSILVTGFCGAIEARADDVPSEKHGLALRAAAGLAAGSVSGALAPRDGPVDGALHGIGAIGEASIGASLGRGVVIAGSVVGVYVSDSDAERQSPGFEASVPGSAWLVAIGPMILMYPNPAQIGLNVQLFAGYAYGSMTIGERAHGAGFAAGPAIGYDFSIGRAATIGPQLRVLYAEGKSSETREWTMLYPALALTMTFARAP